MQPEDISSELEHVLLTEEQIRQRLLELAAQIDADYAGKGVDQLADCVDKIINNPEDRRIIMSAWNPKDLDLMALPPCHMFCQFYVSTPQSLHHSFDSIE